MPRLVTFEDLVEGSVFWGTEVVADAFSGLIASAGYTFSLWCQSLHSIFRTPDTEWAFLGGYELHIKLLQPVRPGDRLRLKLTIGGTRLSSRGTRGHVESPHALMRQDETPVFSVELALLMATRMPA